MKVLIGCERSGTVRRAFEKCGYDATSCDLVEADDGSNNHIQDDIRNILHLGWDLLIAHPPCTRLCNSGVRWLRVPPPGRTKEDIWTELEAGAELFAACWNADIPHIAVENPIMHKYARSRIKNYQPPAQTVQPWQFGDPFFKATSFYIKNLPKLKPTHVLIPPPKNTKEYKAWSYIHRMPPSENRGVARSKTFDGIAEAMAKQWGEAVAAKS